LESEISSASARCRDLLFHVQEQRMSLAQIAHFIKATICAFSALSWTDGVPAAYRGRFPQDRAATDLACWEAFEADHPGLVRRHVYLLGSEARSSN